MILTNFNRIIFKLESISIKCLILFLLFFLNVSRGRDNDIGRMFPHSDVFKWQGCADIKPSDFKEVKLVTSQKHGLKQPAKIHFNKTSDVPNFYFLEKITGKIRYYVDATGEVQEVGVVEELNVKGASAKVWEDGLNGMALDYDFDKTRWMYLWYSVKGRFRISRFKINESNKLVYNTQQIILEIPKKDKQWHAAGAMDFDVYGDLWISVGDNLYGYYNDNHYVSMATANLLGSWLRIHPTEEKQPNGKYYTIPKDNFGEYWAKKFEAQGKTDLARDYRNPKLVLPEIWAKGIRNSWTLKVVEPFRRFVASGECGPDHPKADYYTEEANIANEPKFFGWPIHAGISPTLPFKGKHLASLPGGTVYDSLAPKIASNNKIKGVRTLPPIETAVYSWEYLANGGRNKKSRSCGTGAAMYWYDGYSKSTRKFPPHFHGKYFVTDHDAQWIRVVTLNDDLNKTLSESEFFAPNKQINTEKPLDVTFGPDGALYVIHWIGDWFRDNPRQNISRIEYTGDCQPEEPKSPFRGCTDPKSPNYDPRVKYGCPDNVCCKTVSVDKPDFGKLINIQQQRGALNISVKDGHTLRVFNVNGKIIASKEDKEGKRYNLSRLQRGLYFVSIEIGGQKTIRRVLINF